MKGSVKNTDCLLRSSILSASLFLCSITAAGAGSFAPIIPNGDTDPFSLSKVKPKALPTRAPSAPKDETTKPDANAVKQESKLTPFETMLRMGDEALLNQDLERAEKIFQFAYDSNSKSPAAAHGLARILVEVGKQQEAISLLQSAIKKTPNSAPIHALLGDIWISRGDLQAARRELKAAISLHEKDADSHLRLAQIAAAEGDSQEAIKHSTRCLRINPKCAHARVILAQQFALAGLTDDAIDQLSGAIKESPESSALHLQLGVMQLSKGTPATAIESMKAANRFDPASTAPLEQLTYAFGRRGDWPNASDYAELWTKAEKDNPKAHFMLAWAQLQSNELYEASSSIKESINLAPDVAAAHNVYGLILLDLRKTDDALAQFKQASELAPGDLSPKLNIGSLFICTNRFVEAVAWLRDLAQDNPTQPEVWGLKAYACARAGLEEEAIAAVTNAQSLDKNDTMSLIARSYLDLKSGAVDKAIQALKIVVKNNPTSAFALTELASATLKSGDVKQSLQLAQQALQLAPSNLTTKACMATALHQAGNYDGAILLLKECTARNQKNIELRTQLALAQEKKGEFYDAIKSYEQVLKIDGSYAQALRGLARIALQEKRASDAALLAEQAVSAARHDDEPRLLLTRALIAMRDWVGADRESELLLEQSPKNTDAALLAAQVSFQRNEWTRACERFKFAQQGTTLSKKDLLAYAEALARTNQLAEAKAIVSGLKPDQLESTDRARLKRLVARTGLQ